MPEFLSQNVTLNFLYYSFLHVKDKDIWCVYLKKSEPILLTGSAGRKPKDRPLPPASPKSGNGKNDFKFFWRQILLAQQAERQYLKPVFLLNPLIFGNR
jgi:hypothetical protein